MPLKGKGMGDGKKIRLRNRMIDAAVFVIMLVGVSAVTLVLFYRQTMGSTAGYHSDMKAYILEMQGLDSGYHFPYPVFFRLGALIHLFAPPELSVAIATMALNSLGIVVTKLAFHHLVYERLEQGMLMRRLKGGRGGEGLDLSWLAGCLISVAAISLFFISMLFPPTGIYLPGIRFRYLGVFSPNPFHNATYMAARPFAILAFLWYVKLLPVYEKGIRRDTARDYILFSIFLLLATMTKPSFTLVMVSTAGLVMLYRLLRRGFRGFVPAIQLGLCFVPTFLDLLYQYQGVFVPTEGEEGGVGFCLGEVWAQYCSNIVLAVGLAVGFPLLVLLLNYRDCKKNTCFRFSWQLYLVSFVEAFFLYEKGFRKFDFNFSWGYMYGIFFCHFCALLVLMRKTADKWGGSHGLQSAVGGRPEFCAGKNKDGEGPEEREGRLPGGKKIWLESALLALQWAAYLGHVVCGLVYFKSIFGGAMYY